MFLQMIYVNMRELSNQSRKCGKGAGLGLFPFDSLEPPSYDMDEIAQIKPLYGVSSSSTWHFVCVCVGGGVE